MKKTFTLILTSLFSFILVSCAQKSPSNNSSTWEKDIKKISWESAYKEKIKPNTSTKAS